MTKFLLKPPCLPWAPAFWLHKVLILLIICTGLVFLSHTPHAAQAQPVILVLNFPAWLFARNIVQDTGIHADLLIPAGAGCPHNFSPSPAQIKKLAEARIIISSGMADESLFAGLQKKTGITNKIIVDCAVEKSGTQAARVDNGHSFAAPESALGMVRIMSGKLMDIFPQHRDIIRKNSDSFCDELQKLSYSLSRIGLGSQNRKIAVQHDALAELIRNTALEISVELPSLPAGSANPALLSKIAGSIKMTATRVVAGDAQYNSPLLKVVAREADAVLVILDPVAAGQEDAPLDYYQIKMGENIHTLEHYFGS